VNGDDRITQTVQAQLTGRDVRSLALAPAPGWTPNTCYELRPGDALHALD
jgi:hypothetical protein